MTNLQFLKNSNFTDISRFILKCLDYYFDAEYTVDDISLWLQEEVKFDVERL